MTTSRNVTLHHARDFGFKYGHFLGQTLYEARVAAEAAEEQAAAQEDAELDELEDEEAMP